MSCYWVFDENEVLVETVEYLPDNCTGIVKNTYGDKFWLKNGELHRIGATAKIYEMPFSVQYEYWVDGKQISKLEHDLLYNIMKLKSLL